jgi:hypothetical protein
MALKITNIDPHIRFKKGKNTYKTDKYAAMNIKEEIKIAELPENKEEVKSKKKLVKKD